MTDKKIIKAVVTITIEDGLNYTFGIYNPTKIQREILFDAIGKDSDTPECKKVFFILKWYTNEEDPSYTEVKGHILDDEQIVEINRENWPHYPVLTFSYLSWC